MHPANNTFKQQHKNFITMKKLFCSLACTLAYLLVGTTGFAQAPNAIPYQGVARNAAGNILASQNISLRISIRDVTAVGNVVYSETHVVATTALGLFNVNIGQGTPVSGTLASVNWGNGAKFIQVEMDAAGGANYANMGTTQLNSVPYALFAGGSASLPNGTAAGNTMRWNGTSWVADNALFNNGTNVGIGTTSPAAKLDVAGTVKITDGSQGAGKILKSDANGLASWSTLSGNDVLSSPIVPNLSCPVLAGSVSTGSSCYSVAVSGNYAYVVIGFSNTMQVINIANPASPVAVGSVATGIAPVSVAVSGNYAYVVNQASNTLLVINITNPSSPAVVGTVATGNGPTSVAVSGNYAYVVNYSSNTMQVINITNPSSPAVVGTVATGNGPTSVAVSGNYAYVVNFSSNTLQVINITNPASPVVEGSVATGLTPYSVAVSGNYAYVVNQSSSTMQVINISNPALPAVVGSVATATNPNSVAVSGNNAYVVNFISNTLQVIDITNPALPAVTSSIATGTGPWSVAVVGNYAYVAHLSSYILQVFNLVCSQNLAVTVNPVNGQTTAMQLQWNTSGNDISNTNSGKVGIGTTSPSNKLSVSGNADIGGNLGIGTTSPAAKLDVNGDGKFGDYLKIGTNVAEGYFQNAQDGAYRALATGGDQGYFFQNTNGVNTSMYVGLNGTYAGKVGIGTTSPSNKLSVSGNADISGAVGIGISSNNGSIVPFRVSTSSQINWKGGAAFGSSTANVIMGELAGVATIGGHNSTLTAWANLAINPGGGNVGIGTTAPTATLSVNGSANKPGGGSWTAFSDARLKQNVQPYNDGLSALLKIKPVTYHYNELSGCDTKPKYVGVIAQDLKDVAPYMVSDFTKEGTNYLQVDNSAMTYMLINAVKEQQAQIEAQKAETEKLKADYEARLKALEEKLNKLMGNESANK